MYRQAQGTGSVQLPISPNYFSALESSRQDADFKQFCYLISVHFEKLRDPPQVTHVELDNPVILLQSLSVGSVLVIKINIKHTIYSNSTYPKHADLEKFRLTLLEHCALTRAGIVSQSSACRLPR